MSLSVPSAATQRNLDTSPFPVKAFALLAAFAIAIRCGMFLVCQPGTLLDTGTYQTLAQQLLHLDFRDYKGLRTPGYAVMLLLGGQNYFVVWVIQAAMGVMNTLLLFWLCFVHTGSAPWSFAAGLGHTLALNQLAFEANMVSETAATFLLVLAIASFVRALKEPAKANHGVTPGLLTAVLTLIRNVYIFVGPMFAVLLLVFEKNRLRMAVGLVIAFVAPVLAWMAFNKATINYFGLTSMVGYNLTNHSGAFMEKAGDEYAVVRDIYLKYREQKRAETGRHAMTIFIARDEMMAKTGLDEVGLSRVLTKLSVELFLEYPTPYLKNVADSWVSFWAVPSYFQPEKFTNLAVLRFVQAVWPWEHTALRMINLLAILACAGVLIHALVQRLRGVTGISIPLILSCSIVGASVLQAMVEFGENPRYSIPTQSLTVSLVLLVLWNIRARYVARRAQFAG